MAEGGNSLKGKIYVDSDESPLVSIVTVVFNSVKYLEQAILSVFNQTYTNIEYIIIDGGSTDGSLDIIRRYDERISYWLSEPDKGIYDAMNKGVRLCHGRLIGLLNADDFYLPGTVELVICKTRTEQFDILAGTRIDFEDHEKYTRLRYLYTNVKDIIRYPSINHPGCFIKKSFYEKAGQYDISFKIASDYDFLIRAYISGAVFCKVTVPLVYFRYGGQSSKCLSNIECYDILKKYGFPYKNRYILKAMTCYFKKFILMTGLYKDGWKEKIKDWLDSNIKNL